MSMITYFASDTPLEEVDNPMKLNLIINGQKCTIEDLGTDEDFCIFPIDDTHHDIYSQRKYRAELEWIPTPGRALRILEYLRRHLEQAAEVELWHGWVGGDTAKIIRYEARINEFTPEDIIEIVNLPVGFEPVVHHCVTISRS